MTNIKIKTGDKCQKSGYYRQIETDEITWFEESDQFPPYYQNAADGTQLKKADPKRAHYEFVSDAQ